MGFAIGSPAGAESPDFRAAVGLAPASTGLAAAEASARGTAAGGSGAGGTVALVPDDLVDGALVDRDSACPPAPLTEGGVTGDFGSSAPAGACFPVAAPMAFRGSDGSVPDSAAVVDAFGSARPLDADFPVDTAVSAAGTVAGLGCASFAAISEDAEPGAGVFKVSEAGLDAVTVAGVSALAAVSLGWLPRGGVFLAMAIGPVFCLVVFQWNNLLEHSSERSSRNNHMT